WRPGCPATGPHRNGSDRSGRRHWLRRRSSPAQPLDLALDVPDRPGLETGHRIGAVVGGVIGAGAVVAAGAQAAERHVAGGPRGGAVEVDHARADAADEAVPVFRVVADQTGAEA